MKKQPTKEKPVSDCCHVPLAVVTADEGTSYWECGKCHNACDLATTKEISWEQRVITKFNKCFRNESWYPNNWKPIEAFIRSELSQSYQEGYTEGFTKGMNRGYMDGKRELPQSYQKGRQDMIGEIKEDIESMVIGYIGDGEERETAQNRLNTVFKSLLERKKEGKEVKNENLYLGQNRKGNR